MKGTTRPAAVNENVQSNGGRSSGSGTISRLVELRIARTASRASA
jgi:hypothetical protein